MWTLRDPGSATRQARCVFRPTCRLTIRLARPAVLGAPLIGLLDGIQDRLTRLLFGPGGICRWALPAILLLSVPLSLFAFDKPGSYRPHDPPQFAAANADNRRLYDALEPVVGSYCPGLARTPYHVHRYGARPE